uniref:Uncharacterized protein n=1 Tax=Anguilla anguilla TaxID=7936 RepID=A0A0E9VE08_ANGAN
MVTVFSFVLYVDLCILKPHLLNCTCTGAKKCFSVSACSLSLFTAISLFCSSIIRFVLYFCIHSMGKPKVAYMPCL